MTSCIGELTPALPTWANTPAEPRGEPAADGAKPCAFAVPTSKALENALTQGGQRASARSGPMQDTTVPLASPGDLAQLREALKAHVPTQPLPAIDAVLGACWSAEVAEIIGRMETIEQPDAKLSAYKQQLLADWSAMQARGADASTRIAFQMELDDLSDVTAGYLEVDDSGPPAWQRAMRAQVDEFQELVDLIEAAYPPSAQALEKLRGQAGRLTELLAAMRFANTDPPAGEIRRMLAGFDAIEVKLTQGQGEEVIETQLVTALLRARSMVACAAVQQGVAAGQLDARHVLDVLACETARAHVASSVLERTDPAADDVAAIRAHAMLARFTAVFAHAALAGQSSAVQPQGKAAPMAADDVPLPAYMLAMFERLDNSGINNLKEFMIALTSMRESWRMLRMTAAQSHRHAADEGVQQLLKQRDYTFRKEMLQATGEMVGALCAFGPMAWGAGKAVQNKFKAPSKTAVADLSPSMSTPAANATTTAPGAASSSAAATQTPNAPEARSQAPHGVQSQSRPGKGGVENFRIQSNPDRTVTVEFDVVEGLAANSKGSQTSPSGNRNGRAASDRGNGRPSVAEDNARIAANADARQQQALRDAIDPNGDYTKWQKLNYKFQVAEAIGRVVKGALDMTATFMGREASTAHADYFADQARMQQAQMLHDKMREQQTNDNDTMTRVFGFVDQLQSNATRTSQQIWAR